MNSKLILGTVQFGIPYGINNSMGLLNEQGVTKILAKGHSAGILTLDTAAAYGEAEKRIGNFHQESNKNFKVITKFNKDKSISWNDSIEHSLKNLIVEKVETIMFHSYEAYNENSSKIAEIISEGKGKFFDNIGVSVYTNQELKNLIEDQNIDVVQLPFNLLDNHSARSELLLKLKSKGKIIHTRSCFLQGLFFKDLNNLPTILLPLKYELHKIQKLANEYSISVGQMALNYVLQKEYVDGVLIGVDSLQQLDQNLSYANDKIPEELSQKIDKLSVGHPHLLNPSTW